MNKYFVQIKNRQPVILESVDKIPEGLGGSTVGLKMPEGTKHSDIIEVKCFCENCENGVLNSLTEAITIIRDINSEYNLELLANLIKQRVDSNLSTKKEGMIKLFLVESSRACLFLEEEISKNEQR